VTLDEDGLAHHLDSARLAEGQQVISNRKIIEGQRFSAAHLAEAFTVDEEHDGAIVAVRDQQGAKAVAGAVVVAVRARCLDDDDGRRSHGGVHDDGRRNGARVAPTRTAIVIILPATAPIALAAVAALAAPITVSAFAALTAPITVSAFAALTALAASAILRLRRRRQTKHQTKTEDQLFQGGPHGTSPLWQDRRVSDVGIDWGIAGAIRPVIVMRL
jgi:hypothetical protein